MSSNVDRIRALIERFNETGEIDFTQADPEIELHGRPDVPDTTVWRGSTASASFFERTAESFDPIRWEPREFIDHGRHVIVRAHVVAYGATSGVPIEIDEAQLWTFRDGLLVRLQGFPTIDEAYATAEELDAAT